LVSFHYFLKRKGYLSDNKHYLLILTLNWSCLTAHLWTSGFINRNNIRKVSKELELTEIQSELLKLQKNIVHHPISDNIHKSVSQTAQKKSNIHKCSLQLSFACSQNKIICQLKIQKKLNKRNSSGIINKQHIVCCSILKITSKITIEEEKEDEKIQTNFPQHKRKKFVDKKSFIIFFASNGRRQ
jgi:hypothetical protein